MIQLILAATISHQAQVTPPEPAYLIKTGAIVITDRTDRDDLKKIFAAKTKDEVEALLENGAFEYRILDGRYEIWLSSYFPMRVAQKKIDKLQDMIRRGPQNLGLLRLSDYEEIIAESLENLAMRSNFPSREQFEDTTTGLSYSRVYTLRKNDGTVRQVSIAATNHELTKSLPDVPQKVNPSKDNIQEFGRVRSAQWVVATANTPINSAESTLKIADFLKYLVATQASLDDQVSKLVMELHRSHMSVLGASDDENLGGQSLSELDSEDAQALRQLLRLDATDNGSEWQVLGFETVPTLVFRLSTRTGIDGGSMIEATVIRLDNPAWKSKYNPTSGKP